MSGAHLPRAADRLDLLAMALLTLLCASWGLNQVAIKVANGGISPIFQAGLRSAGGTMLVFIWCLARGIPLFDRDRTLVAGLAAGALFAGEFALIFTGLLYTSAARGVVVLYATPFFVALGAHLFIPGERMTFLRLIGLIAAFLGVCLAFADSLGLPSGTAIIGDAMMLGAAALWAATTIVIKATALARVSAEKTLLYQLAVSAALMFPLSWALGEPGVFAPSPLVLGALAYQTVWVVAITYVIWFWVMIRYPAAQISAFTFLTPLFGVMFGGWLLGERVSSYLIAALALVALGIYLVNSPRPGARSAP
ncbi:MAG: DMT family transporter [Hyphomicrobiales bacterium]|nr:DMT family transporter [Hyphomicrobiales bacterium]